MRVVCLLILFLLLSSPAMAAPTESAGPFPTFSVDQGEHLEYDVKFLWLSHFAKGTLTFKPGDESGTFVATAHAKTQGVAKLVSSHLTQTYQVVMRLTNTGILQPVSTISTRIKGTDEKRKYISRYDFDYENRTVHYRKYKRGKLKKEQQMPMPADRPIYDLLSAFYNWRLGNFGELKRPSSFTLPTITKKGPSDILIGIRTQEDHSGRSEFPKDGLLARVIVDEEVFNTNSGSMFVWVNGKAQPGIVLVEDVMGLGNITAMLR